MFNYEQYKWKYKSPLKNCEGCKYLSFVIHDSKKEQICKIHHQHFLGKCPSKVNKKGER